MVIAIGELLYYQTPMSTDESLSPGFSSEFMRELIKARMPFGKYRGRSLLKLPEAYLIWFKQQGYPAGKLGAQMATVYEIKLNGLEYLFRDLEKFE